MTRLEWTWITILVIVSSALCFALAILAMELAKELQ